MSLYKNHAQTSVPKQQRGFTLLQMLLVIIVLAIAFGFSATFFKQQRNLNTVDTTATDMLQLLQAAQGYYQTNQYWPKDINTLISGAYQGLPRCGTIFLSSQTADTYQCGRYNAYAVSFPRGYGAGIPNTDGLPEAPHIIISTVAANNTMANAIAAKLPNIAVDNSKVEASITPPGVVQSSDFANLMAADGMIMMKSVYTDFLGKDEANAGTLPGKMGDKRFLRLYLPGDCPKDWTPDYDAALMQFAVNKTSTANALRGVYICKKQYGFSKIDAGTRTALTITTDRVVLNDDWYTGGVMIMTYCRPPTVPQATPSWIKTSILNRLKNEDIGACQFGPFTNSNGSM